MPVLLRTARNRGTQPSRIRKFHPTFAVNAMATALWLTETTISVLAGGEHIIRVVSSVHGCGIHDAAPKT